MGTPGIMKITRPVVGPLTWSGRVGSGRVVKSGSISALCSIELNCAILDLTFDRPIIVMAGRVQPVRVIPTAALKALVIEFDRINAANVG